MATLMAPSPVTPVPVPASALLPVYKRAPMELVRGEGICLYDREGREYIDFTSGIAVNALGYGDPGLQQAMVDAAAGLVHVSNLFRTAPGERLAERLVELTFADRVFFCSSGVEANEGAFKFARRWARTVGSLAKHEIIAVRGSFHGRLFASLAATDRPSYRAPFRPLAGGVSIAERDLESLGKVLSAETVAALVIEPIQGEGGVRVFDEGYLRELRALTRERRIALIFDEIQCGLGRTGHLFAYERVDVAISSVSRIAPIGNPPAIGLAKVIMSGATSLQPGDHGTTFGGGPFVASVARHVLDRVAEPGFLEDVRTKGRWLGESLRTLATATGRIREVRGVGFIWGIDVHEPAADVVTRARDAGLLLVGAGDYTIRILPPLVATQPDLEAGLARLAAALG